MSLRIDQIVTTRVLPKATDYAEVGNATPESAKVLWQNFPQKVATIAALKALVIANATDGQAVIVQGYYAAGDGGGGEFYYSAASADADNGGTIVAPNVGAGRWLRNYSGGINIRWFGAKGDGVTNDTAAIQAAVTFATGLPNATVRIPPANVGQYYKVTAPISFTAQLSVVGDSPVSSVIIGVGMAAGQFIFDFNIAVGANYFWRLENVCLRSLDGVPNGLNLKNVSYLSARNLWIYHCYDGITIQGTNCFSNYFESVVVYTALHWGVYFKAFAGGGNYTFTHCTFDGDTGFFVDSMSNISELALHSCNMEACVTNSLYCGGNVTGFSINGGRTELCAGAVDFQINPTGGNIVAGLVISGCLFTAASAACTAIQLGGAGGTVRGFTIIGNRTHDSSTVKFVFLNGDGESGVISGNCFKEAATVPASAQREGVIVFGNENGGGKCAEYWGTATWGVTEYALAFTDASGAGLALTGATGYATKIGRTVFWQGVFTYPVTADGSAAAIAGLPSNPLTSGNTQGRAGCHVDMTNAALDIAIQHGLPNTNKIAVFNRLTGAAITNAQLSGKFLYVSGHYTV